MHCEFFGGRTTSAVPGRPLHLVRFAVDISSAIPTSPTSIVEQEEDVLASQADVHMPVSAHAASALVTNDDGL
jgi:hypothetical protein